MVWGGDGLGIGLAVDRRPAAVVALVWFLLAGRGWVSPSHLYAVTAA
jgi:hypothetical protein